MFLHVTQGHEKGIGLEVFLKSFILLKKIQQDSCILYCFQESLKSNLDLLHFPYTFTHDGVSLGHHFLKCHFLENDNKPESTTSLAKAISEIKSNDILLTLPTSKDQILHPFDESKTVPGHTEYLRVKYGNDHLGMFFKADDLNVLLLTDHVPLKDVPQILTEDFVFNKIVLAINSLEKGNQKFNNVFIAGINPHAGENGLIGSEDTNIQNAITRLKEKFKNHHFHGPLPGDTMNFSHKNNSDLFIYPFHDQGLGVFKSLKKTYGINFTLGLPYIRLSVDHGTAFSLYGKNCANYSGALYCLETVLS